jgi:hypothetical protein
LESGPPTVRFSKSVGRFGLLDGPADGRCRVMPNHDPVASGHANGSVLHSTLPYAHKFLALVDCGIFA